MPKNTTLTHKLSLATMIFEITVLELVKIAIMAWYHILASCAPDCNKIFLRYEEAAKAF